MKLNCTTKIEITPTAPFNFNPTFYKPDHFTSGDSLWEPGTRWQTWLWKNTFLGLKFTGPGTSNKPRVIVEVFSSKKLTKEFLDSLHKEIIYRYNLNLSLADFYNKSKEDKVLSPIIRRLKGMRPGHPSSLYEYLIIGIVLQNATVKRSVQMFKALLENFGTCLEFDGKRLWCFWSIGRLQNVSEQELRNLKVGYRAKSIKKIDDYFFSNAINEMDLRKKNRETQRIELLKLYGVGPATVWYLLFDVFHHWDFFNHISPWEQKIYSKIFFDQDPDNPVSVDKLLEHFKKFGDYKQLAVHYLWEDLWWRHKANPIPWFKKLIRI